ncbi:MAG: MoaD/ThiS family protein [Bacillota bacterium]|nr:MoaD/ThiS family protein [Bacillota bacterium]
MSIKLYLPGSLSVKTKGKHLFEVNGRTVGECLNHLVSLIPEMKDVLFFETGEALAMRSNIEVSVNKKRADEEGLAKVLKDGDQIRIKKNVR